MIIIPLNEGQFFLPKKLSDTQKLEILEMFKKGFETKDIATKYNFASSTIVRQLKIMLGDQSYLKIKEEQLLSNSLSKEETLPKEDEEINNIFFEVIPLTEGVEFTNQKDLTSLSIQEFNFPNILYMLGLFLCMLYETTSLFQHQQINEIIVLMLVHT